MRRLLASACTRFGSFWWLCQTAVCLQGMCNCLQRKLYYLLVHLRPCFSFSAASCPSCTSAFVYAALHRKMFLVPCISPDMSVDENERSVNGVGVSTRGERTVDSGEVAGHPFSRFFLSHQRLTKPNLQTNNKKGSKRLQAQTVALTRWPGTRTGWSNRCVFLDFNSANAGSIEFRLALREDILH